MKCLFILLALFCEGCSPSGPPPDTNVASPGGSPASSPSSPRVTPGGNLQPLPSGAPANSYPTTTGGYVTLNSIVESNVDSSETLIGATMMGNRTIVLFKRSASASIYFWDVFELTEQGSFKLDCSISPPRNSSGSFIALTYDGTSLVVLNSNIISGMVLYQLDPDTCTTGFYKTLYSSTNYYNIWSTPFTYYGGDYYTGISDVVDVINPVTNLVNPFQYSTQSLSEFTPNPDNVSFAIDAIGTTWFVDQSYNLWSGNTNGSWRGWTPLPYETYLDLTNVQNILPGSGSQLNVLTFDNSAATKTLRLYQIDASHF